MKLAQNRSKRRFITAVVSILLFGGFLSLMLKPLQANNPIQYLINQICGQPIGISSCGNVQVTAAIAVPGFLNDYDDNSRKAYLSSMQINASDTYTSHQSSSTCFSTCPVNGSNLVITFGNVCSNTLAVSSGCKQYSFNPISVNVKQVVKACNGLPISRNVTVSGNLQFNGCSKKGLIVFTLSAINSVRGSITYSIPLCGAVNGRPNSSNPCAFPKQLAPRLPSQTHVY